MNWATKVVAASSASLLITIIAGMGVSPEWNIPLALFGVVVPHINTPYLASLLFVLVPTTMLLDITWCAVYGPYLNTGTSLTGLIMTVFNMFLKMLWMYLCFEYMNETGGNPLLVLSPEIGGSSSGSSQNGGHEPIVD